MRVATFNLLNGRSVADGVVDPDRLRAAAVRLDADLVGLQEVDRNQPRSGGVDQAALVADALGAAHWRFAPSLLGTPGPVVTWTATTDAADAVLPDGPTYGVALVSRLPVLAWRTVRFPPARPGLPLLVPGDDGRPRVRRIPDEPRAAVVAEVEGPRGPLSVVVAHLSFVPGANVRQLRALVRRLADLPRPLLLLGDLNLPGPLPRRLTGWTPLATAATYPSWRPRVQFDHVLADGLPPGARYAGRAQALDVSDHCALTVDLAL